MNDVSEEYKEFVEIIRKIIENEKIPFLIKSVLNNFLNDSKVLKNIFIQLKELFQKE